MNEDVLRDVILRLASIWDEMGDAVCARLDVLTTSSDDWPDAALHQKDALDSLVFMLAMTAKSETSEEDRLWRVGRKVGRTLYVQVGAEPSDDDVLVGLMDTADLARLVVEAVNAGHEQDGT